MIKRPDDWDLYCQINTAWIGDQFIDFIDRGKTPTESSLSIFFSMCYRFLFELFLSIKDELNFEFRKVRNFTTDNLNNFEEEAKAQIDFAHTEMPIAILKNLLSSDAIKSIVDLSQTQKEADSKKEAWIQEINKKEKIVNTLKQKLDQYEQAFNFVGLHQGFDLLHQEKKADKRKSLFWLIVFGLLIPIPLAAEIIVTLYNHDNLETAKSILTLTILPTLSISALLIYFFRIILSNYKSTKSLILQIELRKTLCAFIQSYASYSSDIKSKDKDALEKFENIIFSGLVPDDSNIPSTFDGINQLSTLIKSIRN